MIPIKDTTHVLEAQALLTSRYQDQKVIKGLVTAVTLRLQQIENSFWDLINAIQLSNHPMPGGPWDILDRIGAIVGAARNGLDDVDYLALIKLQAKVNRSRGNPEDIIALGVLMLGGAPAVPLYLEFPTAAFILQCLDIVASYPLFVGLLAQARPAGVAEKLIYTTWATGNDLVLGSRYGGQATQKGWGSRYGGVTGGFLSAAVNL